MKKCLITKKEIKLVCDTENLQNISRVVPVFRYKIEINSKLYLIQTLNLKEDLISENEPIDEYIALLICSAIQKKDPRVNGVFSWDGGYDVIHLINLKKLINELSDENMLN